MSYGSVTVLGRVERRRRFSVEQKLAVVAEASPPGANISEIARRYDLVPAQVFKWRRLAELGVIGIPGTSELPSFVAVEITKEAAPVPVAASAPAEVETVPRAIVGARPAPARPDGVAARGTGSERC